MNNPRNQRRDWKAASAVSKVFVPQKYLDQPHDGVSKEFVSSRISTFAILIGDATEKFRESGCRYHAISLIVMSDFCWQLIRELGCVVGDDGQWLGKFWPGIHDQSDQDIGDGFNARVKQIVDDATWMFDLHSFIRHPRKACGENVWTLREPILDEHTTQLVRAASGIEQVLRNVAARRRK